MGKRRRKPDHIGEPYYRKRRRYDSMSPSRGDAMEMDNATRITMLQLNVDILSAQVKLLQKQVNESRKEPPTGQKEESSICCIL